MCIRDRRVPSCSFQPIDIFSSKDRVLWVKKVTHRRAVNFNLCSAHTLHTGSQPSPGAGMSYVVMAEMVASVFEVVAGAGDIVVTGTGNDLKDARDHLRHDHVTHACSRTRLTPRMQSMG